MEIIVSESFELEKTYRSMVNELKASYFANPEANYEIPVRAEVSSEMAQRLYEIYNVKNSKDILKKTHVTEKMMDIFHSEEVAAQLHPNYLPALIHSHSFFEIVYVIRGKCTNNVGNQELQMAEGDLLILAPNTQHAIGVFDDETLIMNIMIKAGMFEELFFKLFKQRDIMYRFFSKILYEHRFNTFLLFSTEHDPFILEKVMNLYIETCENNNYSEQTKVAYLSIIFLHILNKYEGSATIFNDNGHEPNQNLAAILWYTQEHFKTVSLKELSDKFNYSERHILRIFKDYTGKGFQETLQKIRMQHAIELLEQTNASVEKIALDVGYQSVQSFRVAFKRQYCVTPSEYRMKSFGDKPLV